MPGDYFCSEMTRYPDSYKLYKSSGARFPIPDSYKIPYSIVPAILSNFHITALRFLSLLILNINVGVYTIRGPWWRWSWQGRSIGAGGVWYVCGVLCVVCVVAFFLQSGVAIRTVHTVDRKRKFYYVLILFDQDDWFYDSIDSLSSKLLWNIKKHFFFFSN